MGSATIIMMIITLLSKITGLFREQITAYYLGAGILKDVYATATNIPNLIFGFVVAGVGTSFIPLYNTIRKEKNEQAADSFTSNLINILTVFALILTLLIIIFAQPLVHLWVPGYGYEKTLLTVRFTRIVALATIITPMFSVLIAYLNLKGRFTVTSLTGMIMNILQIGSLILAYQLKSFYFIAYGFIASQLLKYYMFPKTLHKENYKHKFLFDIKDPHIREMIWMSLPVIISITAVDISTIIDQSIASVLYQGAHGAVSSLSYASLILQLVSGVIVVSVATAMYPKISLFAANGEHRKLKSTLMKSVNYSMLLVAPATVGLMVLSYPTVELLFERGAFGPEDTYRTAQVLLMYLPSLLGLTVKDLVVRGFYAQKDIKTPVKITVIQMTIQVILSLTLSRIFGLKGLALSTSIASLSSGAIILYMFRKKYGKINLKNFTITNIKILSVALIMGIFTYFSYNFFAQYNHLLAFGISIIISAIVYGVIIIFMKIPEVKEALRIVIKRFDKK